MKNGGKSDGVLGTKTGKFPKKWLDKISFPGWFCGL